MEKSIHISQMAPIIEEMLQSGKTAEISPGGVSMYPNIREGDKVILQKPSFPLKKYSVALYKRGSGVVLHRVVGIKKDGYAFAGDAQKSVEYPVHENDIIAVAKKVLRGGSEVKISRAKLRFMQLRLWKGFLKIWLGLDKKENMEKQKNS